MTVPILFSFLTSWAFIHGLTLLVWLCLAVGGVLAARKTADYRRRLRVMDAVASVAAFRGDPSRIQDALRRLAELMGARAAWFQMLEGDDMVLKQHLGIPEPVMAARHRVPRTLSQVLPFMAGLRTVRVRAEEVGEPLAGDLTQAGLRHLIFTPILRDGQLAGLLALGFDRRESIGEMQLDFLSTAASQLGLAAENLNMIERVLLTQRQWLDTIDSLDDGILIHDAEPRLLRINSVLARRLGKAPAEIAGKTLAEVLPVASDGCPYCEMRSASEEEDPCFGGYSLVTTSPYVDERTGRAGIAHIICDRTERRAAEERYRLLFESVQEGVFVSTPEGRLIDCNPAFATMLGYADRDEILATDLGSLYRSESERAAYVAAMEASGKLSDYEIALRRKDGKFILCLENSFAIRRADGSIERYQGFLLDITDKKRAEQDLRRRNRELAALNAMATVATQTFDLAEILVTTTHQMTALFAQNCDILLLEPATGKLRRTQTNRAPEEHAALCRLVETELVEPLKHSASELITEHEIGMLPPATVQWLQATSCRSMISVLLQSKGNLLGLLLLTSSQPDQFNDGDRAFALAIARQLGSAVEKVGLYEEATRAYDNLRATQEQLLHSEKMSAVGQLVSGVAHELNNPLTAVLGYAQLLELQPLGEKALDYVRKLYQQTQRTHRVVQNLLAFSRQRKPIQSQVDLRRVLEDSLSLREFDLKLNRVTLTRDCDPQTPFVTGDPHQLGQVFLNILNNAVDAVMDSGKPGSLHIRIGYDEKHVFAEFRDTGNGLKDPSKIFDPFYTTKGIGKGTGLGLSICYGIVKEHGGEITAVNHPDGGALFRVTLPIPPSQSGTLHT